MSEYDANARFLRESIVEPDAITRARAHAVELGAMPISAAVGSQIAVLAEGGDLTDPAEFAKLLAATLTAAITT